MDSRAQAEGDELLMGPRFVAAFMCLGVVSQTATKTPQRQPRITPPREVYSNAEFNLEKTSLPQKFDGHSIQELMTNLERERTRQEKGEFESTFDWQRRLIAARKQPILGSLTLTSYFAFVLERQTQFRSWDDSRARFSGVLEEINESFQGFSDAANRAVAANEISHREAYEDIKRHSEDQIEQLGRAQKALNAQALITKNLIDTANPLTVAERKLQSEALRAANAPIESQGTAVNVLYNADRERFEIAIEADMLGQPGTFPIRVLTGPASTRSYIGSNGFGSTEEVTEQRFTEYRLLIANSDDLPFVSSFDPKRIRVEIPVARENANEIKPQIQALVIVQLTAPFTSSSVIRRNPTHDDPISLKIEQVYLRANLLAIWIYNRETGVVYARILPTN